nr:hypothetical protein CFP56_14053 [Quercus suber]
MSQKVGRHQRKPSQSVFISLEDLSAPSSDNAAADKAVPPPPPHQALPPQQTLAPPPSTPAPPSASTESLPKNDTKPADLGN